MENKLWYKQPARVWEEALPIGNGRLGAIVFGGIDIERLQINEDTLWSGYKMDTTSPDVMKELPKIRKLIFDGKYKEAEDIIEDTMFGPWSQSYLPLGNLYIKSLKSNNLLNYSRELNIENAIATVEYELGGSGAVNVADIRANQMPIYKREFFASAIHNVIVMHITANNPQSINISAFLDSDIISTSAAFKEGYLMVSGKAPSHVEPSYVKPIHKGFTGPVIYDDSKNTIKFCSVAKVINIGGTMNTNGNKIEIIEADEVLFIIAACTDFKVKNNLEVQCKNDIENACKIKYDELLKAHIKDYQSYYNRMTLELGGELCDLPTDERLKKVKDGSLDVGLEELIFNYGRYLLISSSRPGTQPTNLQGIWNHEVRPPWSCNLTLNINAQMNYWLAETCNLSECHTPFLEAVCEMCESGKKTARVNYNARGSAANHTSDIWRLTTAVGGKAKASYWPMGCAWAVRHLFEHYEFSQDIEYLRNTAFPIMKAAAVFFIDWLVEDKEGHLVTCPSVSPENNFITNEGEICSVSYGTTMDNSIIRDLFENCIKSCDVLGIETEFCNRLKEILGKLLPFKIGKSGQLLEWVKEFKEAEIGHRHISHLYGLYPASLISHSRNPELINSCQKTLERRLESGGGHTGWSCAWIINLYARLNDGENAHKFISILLEKSMYDNLFDSHPPFQIDGNFGYCAGVAEMLVQSHEGEINLLPALPKAWSNHGKVMGLRCRGGYTVDIEWVEGKIVKSNIISNRI